MISNLEHKKIFFRTEILDLEKEDEEEEEKKNPNPKEILYKFFKILGKKRKNGKPFLKVRTKKRFLEKWLFKTRPTHTQI